MLQLVSHAGESAVGGIVGVDNGVAGAIIGVFGQPGCGYLIARIKGGLKDLLHRGERVEDVAGQMVRIERTSAKRIGDVIQPVE